MIIRKLRYQYTKKDNSNRNLMVLNFLMMNVRKNPVFNVASKDTDKIEKIYISLNHRKKNNI